ncbi:rho GTPase-activating protein SYDE1 [Rhineura floridana]|uniref:rho GTPase-activating protein SYDE1 n=1 Tax=Rhineura floridana TaxID=261503 RepID=UPI002AC85DF8|nr:rho GTPase-activating protein SYDE1 [Rhineura floridana]
MAQPLLRKTFSRLRGKERLERNKAAQRKEPDSPSEASGVLKSSLEAGPLPLDDGCRKGATITVSRKQTWAKFTWSGQEDSRNRKLSQSSSSAPQTDLDEGLSPESLPCIGLVGTGPKETTGSLANYIETCDSSISAKGSTQGAYLQSLERSSRHWVLSSGKTQGAEAPTASSSTELKESSVLCSSEGEIWYNPIPEDEDLQLPNLEKKWGSNAENRTWKGKPREAKATGKCIHLGSLQKTGSDGLRTLPSHARPVKQAEELSSHQSQGSGKVAAASMEPEGRAMGTALMAQSPNVHKKGHTLSKAKSPGPVRSLSMKMKKLPELRRKLSLRSSRPRGPEPEGGSSPKESSNVISRYHLDSSVASRQSLSRGKAASKGGYLSDGDSPELLAKPEAFVGLMGGSFRPYSFAEQASYVQHLSGLVSIHLLGVQDFRPLKAKVKEVFCVLQVDSVNKARTALLPCQAAFLNLNHSFQLELEDAQLLKVVVFSCDPAVGKNRVCCHGTLILPHVFQGCQSQQLAMQLEPQGLLYIKLTLVDQWDLANSDQEPQVFGVKLSQLVEREGATIKVPLLIQKCVAQIEKRGLKVVGLYRLCGSAAVKKELRDAFERDSADVVLSEDLYPDINAITGILKDYLRELPTPLITHPLYQVVLEAMSHRAMGLEEKEATTALLDCLPEAEKATLTMLLDHLSLVAASHTFNRMNAQNLAVCFGPVLLSQGAGGPGDRGPSKQHRTIASTMDFKHHIEVLHYLLQAWPAPHRMTGEEECPLPSRPAPHQCRPPLNLPLLQTTVVARSRPRGLESPPSNRYAGDWSVCGQQFLVGPRSGGDTDYDKVAGSESDNEEENEDVAPRDELSHHSHAVFMGDFALVEDPEAPFSARLNLKDFDALILDLERELSKQINVCL